MQIWEIDSSKGIKTELTMDSHIEESKFNSWFPDSDLHLNNIQLSEELSFDQSVEIVQKKDDFSEDVKRVLLQKIFTGDEVYYLFSLTNTVLNTELNLIASRMFTSLSGRTIKLCGKVVSVVFKNDATFYLKPNLFTDKSLKILSHTNFNVPLSIFNRTHDSTPSSQITTESINNLKRGLLNCATEIQYCDAFYSFNGLNYLLKKNSINKRFELFLLAKVKEPRARILV